MTDYQMPMFPRVIAELIADYCATWELIPEAQENKDKLDIVDLSRNPRGCDYLKPIIDKFSNPKIKLPFVDKDEEYHFWRNITVNPGAKEIAIEFDFKFDIEFIGSRSFPWTEHILRRHIKYIDEWRYISSNPVFIDILQENLEKICLIGLCTNPTAIDLIEQKLDQIFANDDARTNLCKQPWAIHLLERYESKLDWKALSGNSAAVHLLRKNLDKVDWREVNWAGIMDLLKEYPEKIDIKLLVQSTNPDALSYIQAHMNEMTWDAWGKISLNPFMIDILAENTHEDLDWEEMHSNSTAGCILLEHPEHIQWNLMGDFPEIFEAIRPAGLVDLLST